MTNRLLEVCVADPQSLVAAVAGGGDRIELCSGLELGGLTPSAGLMRLAAAAPVPVYAIVRPRSGDFVCDDADVDAMLGDIDAIRAAGLAGVVLGASRPSGELDLKVLTRLRDQAAGLGSTLHRAIDLVPDFAEATEAAITLRFERILTSGGVHVALDGIDNIATAVSTSRGRIKIMAGSGLTPANVGALLAAVPVDEVHSSCASAGPAGSAPAVRLGFAAETRRRTDAAVVRAFKAAMAG
ncbi:copper homeostasis protein CutC [Devosia sp.]|uniref:copper homeostasis protein CutC n=1 Tax=Devosia sp. TaxID=1871048 RepID=UPI003F720FF0